MERGGPPQVKDEPGCRCTEAEVLVGCPRCGYILGVRHCGLELTEVKREIRAVVFPEGR